MKRYDRNDVVVGFAALVVVAFWMLVLHLLNNAKPLIAGVIHVR